MNVLITGGTGHIGSHLAREAERLPSAQRGRDHARA
jgi:nucleoside-diphosphate-sugar epimerase